MINRFFAGAGKHDLTRRGPSFRRVRSELALLLLLGLAACAPEAASRGGAGQALRVSGSTTVSPVAADAAEELRARGMQVIVDSQGGSAGGISQLGQGQVEVAMSSKPIAESDRQAFPSVHFVPTEIGQDAVGIVVRKEVFEGGVRNLSRGQARRLFEGQIRNWSQLGGPDLPVFIYDKEPGRGTREQLDTFLYGSDGQAPPPPATANFAIVGGNEETRTKLISTPGSVGPLSTSFVAGIDELAIVALDGIEPSNENVRRGTYPMARPLYLITDGAPTGQAKTFIDFVVSDEGQRLVRKHGYLTPDELGRP